MQIKNSLYPFIFLFALRVQLSGVSCPFPCLLKYIQFHYYDKMIVKHFFTGKCKDPGQPQNGGRIGDNFGYGSNVTFWCQSPSYVLVGASRITCKEGKWSDKTPSCEGWSNKW